MTRCEKEKDKINGKPSNTPVTNKTSYTTT